MKKKVIKVLATVIMAAALLWVAACAWLVTLGPRWLETRIKTAYPHNVKIRKVTTNLINAVTLHDVTFEGAHPGSITAARVVMSWHGPRVALTGLNINVDAVTRSSEPISIPVIPVPVELAASRLHLQTAKGDFFIENLEGHLRDFAGVLTTSLHGDEKNWGPVEARLEINRSTPMVWKAEIVSPSLNVAQLHTLADPATLPGELSGRAEVKVKAEGTLEGDIAGNALWSIEANGKALRWRAPDADSEVPVSASLKITPQNIAVSSLKIDRNIFISGNIASPLTTADLNLNVTANNWPLSRLKNLAPSTKNLLLGGSASFDMALTGSKSEPLVQGNFSVSPTVGELKLPPANGQLSMKDNKTNVLADFAKGKLSLQQAEVNATNDKYLLVLQDVSLNAIAQENGWNNVQGSFNTTLSASVKNGSPKLKGSFSIDNLQWGRTKKQTTTTGDLALSPTGISLTTEDGTLLFKSEQDKNQIRLEDFLVDFGAGAKISARGVYDRQDSKLNFAIDGRGIPPDIWPPLVSRYPDIAGVMDFSGTAQGTSQHPVFNINTTFKDIQFIPSGSQWNGSAAAEWSSAGFALKDIYVDGGYEGLISFKKNVFAAEMSFVEADPKLIFDLLKSTLTTSGRLSGEARLQNDGTGFVGVSSTVWNGGQIGPVHFEEANSTIHFNKSTISIDDISVIHEVGAMRGAGTVTLQNEFAKFNITGQLQQVGFPKVKFDGEINASGVVSTKDGTGRARVSSPLLLVNDYGLENADIRLENHGNIIQVLGTGANALAFELKANQRRKTVSGHFSASDIDLSKTIAKIFTTIEEDALPEGPCDVSASIEGPWDDPVLHAKLKLAKGRWKNEPLSSSLVFDLTRSTLTIKGAEVALENGGTVFLSGLMPFDAEQSVSMTGAGSALNLQTVMNLLGWPLTWDGKTDATFSMIGAGPSRKIVVTFDGHHNGFGPIKEGGKLSGTAVWQNGEWNLSGVRVDTGDGFARLRDGSVLFIDKNKTGKMRLVADTRNVRMGVLTYFGRLELTGSWDGAKTTPDGKTGPIELEIFARSLWINQYVLDGNVTHLTIEKNRLKFSPIIGSNQQLSGSLDYADYPNLTVNNLKLIDDGVEQFYLDGLVGPKKWDFRLHTKKIDASVVRGLFDTALPLSGPMEVKLVGQGTFDNPHISATVDWRDGKIGSLPMDQATCSVRLKNGIIEINDMQVERKKGFVLTGNIRMGTALLDDGTTVLPKMDLKLTKGNMELLESLIPGFAKAKGSFEGELTIDAVKGEPQLKGFLTASGISFHSSSYFPNLRKGELELRLDNELLRVEKARAQIGKGVLNSSGTITFDNGVPDSYALRLFTTEHGVSVRIPDLAIPPGAFIGRFSALKSKLSGVSRGEPRFDLSLTGPALNPTLAGTIWLDNTIFTYPPTETVQRSAEATWIQSWFRDLYRNLNWNLTLIAGKRTQYENNLVSAAVSGNLTLTGPTQNLDVRGNITTDQGVIVYAGNEFKIQEAYLEILPESELMGSDHSGTLVYLRASAEREIFYTDVSGNNLTDVIFMDVDRSLIGEIQPRFRSKNNPGLPSNRALQLALGIPLSESLEDNLPPALNRQPGEGRADVDRMLRLGLVQLIDSNLTSPLARALARQTGLVDSIRVSYEEKDTHAVSATSATNDPTLTGSNPGNQNAWWRQLKGTKVKFGRELTSRLFADYSFKVDEFQNEVDFRHEVELAYRVHRNLFIRATSELDSEQTLGRSPDRRALVENRWRFGLPRPKTKPETQP